MFQGMYHGKQQHSADLPAVLTHAFGSGLQRIIVTGGTLEESRAALAIADSDGSYAFDRAMFAFVVE
jgi:TatD DNase family protein